MVSAPGKEKGYGAPILGNAPVVDHVHLPEKRENYDLKGCDALAVCHI